MFIYYGHRSCGEQLIHNGFVDINNSRDAVTVKVGLSKSDPLAEQRTLLMSKLRIIPGNSLTAELQAVLFDASDFSFR